MWSLNIKYKRKYVNYIIICNYYNNSGADFLYYWRLVRTQKQGIKGISCNIFLVRSMYMDTTGTTLMSRIADNSAVSGKLLLHGITGFLAIGLMFIHAIWATVVICKRTKKKCIISTSLACSYGLCHIS